MFFSWITRLREKPEHVRYRMAFWCAFAVTAFVLCVFLLTKLLGSGFFSSHTTETMGGEQKNNIMAPVPRPQGIFGTDNVFEAEDPAEIHTETGTSSMATTSLPTSTPVGVPSISVDTAIPSQ
jgi:hypothetical protein